MTVAREHVWLVIFEVEYEGEEILSLHASAGGAAQAARERAPKLGFHGEEIAETHGPCWTNGRNELGVGRMEVLP